MTRTNPIFQFADRKDVAEIFRSADPLAEIDKRLKKLDEAEAALARERSGLEQLRGAYELIVGTFEGIARLADRASEKKLREPRTAAERRRPAAQEIAETAAAAPELTERQEAALKLMREDPNREWRLRDIVAGVTQRGWLEPAAWLDNQLAKELPLLVPQGLIERPKKGVYKLPSEPVAAVPGEEREARSTEAASRNGSGSGGFRPDLFGSVGPAPGMGPGSSD